jgi:hypothetical protein
MARTRTVEDIIALARLQGDMENTDFVTSAEYISLVDLAHTELYDILVRAGMFPREDVDSITSTGVAEYVLNTDFYGCILVERQVQTGRYRTLKEIQPSERNNYSDYAGSHTVAYRLKKNASGADAIEFFPAPATGVVFRVHYVPVPTRLTATADTINGISGWEKYLVDLVVEMVKIREEDDTAAIARAVERTKARIEEAVENLRLGEATTIARTRDAHDNDDFDYYDWVE